MYMYFIYLKKLLLPLLLNNKYNLFEGISNSNFKLKNVNIHCTCYVQCIFDKISFKK